MRTVDSSVDKMGQQNKQNDSENMERAEGKHNMVWLAGLNFIPTEPGTPLKGGEEPEEPPHGIKCKYMRAAHGYLGNTTFHGISWVTTDVSNAAKVT